MFRERGINIFCLTTNPSQVLPLSNVPGAAVSVIETHDLRKNYGKIEALKGVSIRVEKGQI